MDSACAKFILVEAGRFATKKEKNTMTTAIVAFRVALIAAANCLIGEDKVVETLSLEEKEGGLVLCFGDVRPNLPDVELKLNLSDTMMELAESLVTAMEEDAESQASEFKEAFASELREIRDSCDVDSINVSEWEGTLEDISSMLEDVKRRMNRDHSDTLEEIQSLEDGVENLKSAITEFQDFLKPAELIPASVERPASTPYNGDE